MNHKKPVIQSLTSNIIKAIKPSSGISSSLTSALPLTPFLVKKVNQSFRAFNFVQRHFFLS